MAADIHRILVANRGEIAVRILRTCRQMGIRTVAVYSDADSQAPHVKLADDAVRIGAAPVADSYLHMDSILEAARISGADAIHPGYGFLSENAAFASACAEHGLTFIGPPPDAIRIMGDKAVSKRAMLAAGVPCIAGYQGAEQSDERLISEAASLGLPLMVKAAAGGGGRGMRLVKETGALAESISMARSEAQNAFGSGELILEQALLEPRHVEIQVFADHQGHTIHLGERDCSVQRRHQKVVEESPCPVMTSSLRQAMGEAAVAAARAVHYVGAGTVEFLLDKSGSFYFLEMNTRLQVEHPVTELVTGLDLVALQISVARGEPLPYQQGDITLDGHAIEVRLYAEDPAADFLPCTGPVLKWHAASCDGIRIDAGIATGSEISPYYDAMVAKVIAHGSSRGEARQKLISALEDVALFGTATNRDFLIEVLRQPTFADGNATTAFIDQCWPGGYHAPHASPEDVAATAVVQYLLDRDRALRSSLGVNRELLEWTSTGALTSVYRYPWNGALVAVTVHVTSPGCYQVTLAQETPAEPIEISLIEMNEHVATLRLNGRHKRVLYCREGQHTVHVAIQGSGQFTFTHQASSATSTGAEDHQGTLRAPMPGVLVEVKVHPGAAVRAGDPLAVLEAMKMQHQITAPMDGTVTHVHVSAGDQVAADDPLIEIESPEPAGVASDTRTGQQ